MKFAKTLKNVSDAVKMSRNSIKTDVTLHKNQYQFKKQLHGQQDIEAAKKLVKISMSSKQKCSISGLKHIMYREHECLGAKVC